MAKMLTVGMATSNATEANIEYHHQQTSVTTAHRLVRHVDCDN